MARQTSRAAFVEIRDNGLLSQRRFEAYAWLFRHGPATSRQILVGLSKGKPVVSQTRARLTELRDLGVVREVRTVVDQVTGMMVILWDVTKSLPTGKVHKVSVRKTLRQEINRLTAEVDRLTAENRTLKMRVRAFKTLKRIRKVEQG